MTQSTMEAYAEVDTILGLMNEEYIKQIPTKLRNMFKEKKAHNYTKEISADIPLEEQGLNRETLAILAVLNYNYWCKDEEKKKELIELYTENEHRQEQELREKYNPDNLFKNKEIKEEVISEDNSDVSMTVVEEETGLFSKIIGFFKRLFKK